jgi:nucleoside-diphosphate-sugar epimerase
MKILFIGGTGLISTACTRRAAEMGLDLTLLNRGRRSVEIPPGVRILQADIKEPEQVQRALADESFDSVVNWIAFKPEDIQRDVELFSGRTGQYVFISSASVYQKPATHHVITESTPLANPHWQYSRNKIASEEALLAALRDTGFPATIVRPSLTYGDWMIPLAFQSWRKQWTVVDRMLRGERIIVPGDGTSLWVTTHNTDFAKGLLPLLGNIQTIGHSFHITTDEVLTWDQHYRIVGRAVGVEPQLVHVPSDLLAAFEPSQEGNLLGDKAISVVFDNSKLKTFVPDYCATTTLASGVAQSVAWYRADPERQQIDEDFNRLCDRILAAMDSIRPE